MDDYLALALGVLCAWLGGELFVRGIVGLGHWARLPARIIGVTLAAFATSSPELSVAINSALAGVPDLTLGDALGSNVVNIGLVLAIALLISGIQTSFAEIRRDFLIALLTPILIGLLAWDGQLSRLDSLILLSSFLLWLVAVIREAQQHRSAAGTDSLPNEQGWQSTTMLAIIGLAFLIAAGRLIVSSAKSMAVAAGVDEFVIGATIVAVATGTPELATTVISKLRGHDELSLGNILGSNIFNGLLIVAVAASLAPISIVQSELAVGLIFGVITTVAIFPSSNGVIGRRRGGVLLLIYVAYVLIILQQ
jgi:cation:H+ antiporter